VLFGLIAILGLPSQAQDLPQAVTTDREMIVTANPLATRAGAFILRIGGSATDAMIAAQTVLGLVEPQSSGLGGGAFIVYYDAKTQTTTTFDGREKAPAAATEARFLDSNSDPLSFFVAWQSGLSVGVPGVPRLLEVMHQRFGHLPWPRLFVPAKVLAQKGFRLTETTSSQVATLLSFNPSCADGERLFFRDPTAFNYFVNAEDCTAKPAGTKIRNKDYAKTLKRLAKHGSAGFYTGDLAADIAAAVQGDLTIPGDMMVADLAAYEVVEREPICIDYRGRNVCGMGPPSSGGLAVGQILGILENFALGTDPLAVDAVHLFTQAGRLAFADRNLYVADSDFVTVPAQGMLNKDYLASRAALIGFNDLGTVDPGVPTSDFDPSAPDPSTKNTGTTHISIVDRYGNALSMTSSIEAPFGNGVMVPGWGFLLNNQLTDCSFAPESADGTPIANRVEPNKRPRSSMSPTIVFDDQNNVELLTGSPGGSRIIGYTAQSIINVFDFDLDPQEAVSVPHFMNRNGSTDLEAPIPGVTLDFGVDALKAALEARGHPVSIVEQTSGLGVIQVTEEGFIGGADPRRDTTVGGQ
jgi:gamma-glutamyltranspeptidase/glutathione hydrolase